MEHAYSNKQPWIRPTDPAQIRIIDDFLPDYDYTQSSYSNWWNLPTNYPQYKEHGFIGTNVKSSDIPHMQRVEAGINHACRVLALPALDHITTHVLLVSEYGSSFETNIHVDDTSPWQWGYTFSYHWLGAEGSGGTVFYDDLQGSNELHRVEFRPNRLAVFPASYPHTGYAHPDQPNQGRRVLLSTFTVLAGTGPNI